MNAAVDHVQTGHVIHDRFDVAAVEVRVVAGGKLIEKKRLDTEPPQGLNIPFVDRRNLTDDGGVGFLEAPVIGLSFQTIEKEPCQERKDDQGCQQDLGQFFLKQIQRGFFSCEGKR